MGLRGKRISGEKHFFAFLKMWHYAAGEHQIPVLFVSCALLAASVARSSSFLLAGCRTHAVEPTAGVNLRISCADEWSDQKSRSVPGGRSSASEGGHYRLFPMYPHLSVHYLQD